MKGKENKSADCLSRLFPVIDKESSIRETPESPEGNTGNSKTSSEESEEESSISSQLPGSSQIPGITDASSSCIERRMDADQLISDEEGLTDERENYIREYKKWITNRMPSRASNKPNAGGKLWRVISKERKGSQETSRYTLPPFNETQWLAILGRINQETMAAKLTITRYHFVDPTITPLEKLKIQDYLNFLSNKN